MNLDPKVMNPNVMAFFPTPIKLKPKHELCVKNHGVLCKVDAVN